MTFETPQAFLKARIEELEKSMPHRDGFDDAWISAYRHLLHEYRGSDGWGDGGLTTQYVFGLHEATTELMKFYKKD